MLKPLRAFAESGWTSVSAPPRSDPGGTRIFWPAVSALLIFLAAVQVSSSLRESNIADESTELAAGYSYLKRGDFRMNPEHPPLAKLVQALPLLKFHLAFAADTASWSKADELAFGIEFFDTNAREQDAFLFASRLTSILTTSCLGLAIAMWTRANFGAATALCALTLYCFDPTVTAHGRYVKNDVMLALFVFLACVAWSAFLRRASARDLLSAGLALGLALATKFSALLLLPVLAILLAIHAWQAPRRSLALGAVSFLGVAGLAGCVVFLSYAIPAAIHGVKLGGLDFRAIQNLVDRSESGAMARIAARIVHPGLHAHPFFEGLAIFLDHNTVGHPSYLLGMHSMKGWWYYFPVAFAVKTPTATLAFLGLAAFAGLRMLRAMLPSMLHQGRVRSVSFSWFVLAVPLGVFCSCCLASHVDIGIRYLLPAWPFLFILSAALFTRARFHQIYPASIPDGAIPFVLGFGLAAESISIYPHYLAFFNVLAGGPRMGGRILADSNIDWGQDAKQLRAWLNLHPASRLCVDYFGTTRLERLGIRAPALAALWKKNRRVSLDCVAAVSVNQLEGVYIDPGDYAWLRDIRPDARIGYSIYIYDLPKRASLGLLPLQHFVATPKFQGVVHQDLRGPPTPRDPARPGEILSFLMTGLGPVNPPIPQGRPAPEYRLGYTELPLFCQWNAAAGGPAAEVLYSGTAPHRFGVYQVNIRVPLSVAAAQLTCRSGLFSGGQSEPASVTVN